MLCSQRSQSALEDYKQVSAEQNHYLPSSHEITSAWLLRLTWKLRVTMLPRSQKRLCHLTAEGKKAPVVLANTTKEYSLPDHKFGDRALVLSRHLRGATSSTQLPHLRLCQSPVHEKEVEKKTKTENQWHRNQVYHQRRGKKLLPGLYRQPAEALKHRFN